MCAICRGNLRAPIDLGVAKGRKGRGLLLRGGRKRQGAYFEGDRREGRETEGRKVREGNSPT